LEYVKRDILNLALGNTDNHGRNTAVIKMPDGTSALSPLFDFAPMFLDPEGIPRSSRWEQEKATGTPEWGLIAEALNAPGISNLEFRRWFAGQATEVEGLPDLMESCGVESDIIEKLNRRINNLARTLREAESKNYSVPR
jgi:serine/threonine-protein kinase HipA